jgi:hypothetical protein
VLRLRSEQSSDELIDSAATLREDLDPGSAVAGVTPHLVGQPTIWAVMQEISKRDLSKAEASGFPIVALILLVIFGSLAAALPLALGFVSVLVTGALIYFISLQMTTSVFVTNMASMIGIGVAIDYSLFILARYREEREAGLGKREARAKALSTSGLAVSFSGLAVIISLAGPWMVDNQALRSMALGAMTVVAVSILTATTLLPALIAMRGERVPPGGVVGRVERFLKHRVLRRSVVAAAPASVTGPSRFWSNWTARVMAHPWTAVIELEGFDHVIVLSAEGLDAQRADARTLVTLLHLRDMAERREAKFTIVSEMIDDRNRQLAEVTRVDDVIVSDKIISLMLTQISENRELSQVFGELFSAGGSELYLRPASDYVCPAREVSYATVVEAARRRGECAIGFRAGAKLEDPGSGFGVRINPAKSERVTLVEGDRVIVLAEGLGGAVARGLDDT